jgi:hypothetical protein
MPKFLFPILNENEKDEEGSMPQVPFKLRLRQRLSHPIFELPPSMLLSEDSKKSSFNTLTSDATNGSKRSKSNKNKVASMTQFAPRTTGKMPRRLSALSA